MDGVDKNQLAVDHLKDAAAKSPLDLLSSYKEVLRDGDLETAAVLLRLAANEEPSHQLVTRVNDMLGIALDTQDTQALLEIARARRADTVIENVAEKRPDAAVASPVGSRIHAAHQAVADAPRRSRLDALAIYKRAVTEHNPEAAALALSGIAQGPVDVALVAQTNELLGLEDAIIPAEQIAGQAAAPQ
jgi:ribosomal protein L12E/L44/L45/RPP1/RPP2